MNIFLGIIGFLLLFVVIMVLVAMHYVRGFYLKIKKTITGDLDDEETFRRMADKHYRGNNDPKFDKDYFKGAGKQQQQRGPESNTRRTTTTTTGEGVTIIDERPHEEKRKIFEQEEGEYVDFTEVKD